MIAMVKVRELFDSSDKWTQGALARCQDGTEIHPRSDAAVRWSLGGAIAKCYSLQEFFFVVGSLYTHIPATGLSHYHDAEMWNDAPGRTFEEVKRMVDECDI